MKTELIDIKRYCELSGYSLETRYVHSVLRKGNLLTGMVKAKKIGNSWAIHCSKDWVIGKEREKNEKEI